MKKIFFLSIVLVCLLIGGEHIVFAEEPPFRYSRSRKERCVSGGLKRNKKA
jgi:hypothetical protein